MKRQRLGQHFLTSDDVRDSVIAAAKITGDDVVLEVGPGRGYLTWRLCALAKRVVAVEADRALYLGMQSGPLPGNLDMVYGDGFAADMTFDVFVSNLPYSQSRRAMEWLSRQRFSRGVVTVQQEFADKIAAGNRDRRSISVLASWAFDVDVVRGVPRRCFEPPPKVDSVILRLVQKNHATYGMISAINRLFSQRRKTTRNILSGTRGAGGDDRRLEDLTNEEIISIARSIR